MSQEQVNLFNASCAAQIPTLNPAKAERPKPWPDGGQRLSIATRSGARNAAGWSATESGPRGRSPAVASRGGRWPPGRTRRHRPQTNGKVERFNKTLVDEWAHVRPYRSNAERCRAFTRWFRFYDHRRPHTSLDGLTPMAALVNNPRGNYT
jgi:transposase InsO family protein